MKFKKFGALLLSAVLCIGMAAPAFAFEGEAAPVEQPVLPEVVEEDVVTITDETSGALTPEGNLTLVDDYHTNYSDGSGQQFITLVSKSGATFYLVIRQVEYRRFAHSTAKVAVSGFCVHQKTVWHPAKTDAPPGCREHCEQLRFRTGGRTDLPIGLPASGLQEALFPPVAVQHGGNRHPGWFRPSQTVN